MVDKMYMALIIKDWIKLRKLIWILPILLIYASIDSYLVLSTIKRMHEAFGLWVTLLSNEPPFFSSFQLLGVFGLLIGFCQAWPETHGKKIRLIFHLPLKIENITLTMLGLGVVLLVLTNFLAYLLLYVVSTCFYLPKEFIIPIFYSIAPFSVLSFVGYFGIIAFLGANKNVYRLFILASTIIMYRLLWAIPGYGSYQYSLVSYIILGCCFGFVVLYIFMQAMGEPRKNSLFEFNRAISLLLFTVLLLAILPNQYWRINAHKSASQRLYYSPVENQFVQVITHTDQTEANKNTSITSLEDGRELNTRETALALPILHAENLQKWNIFPKSIAGVELTLREAKYNWNYSRLSPRDVAYKPIELGIMLESNPEGAKLEFPTDIFKLNSKRDEIVFMLPFDGSKDVEKSALFTKALAEQGFVFPVIKFAGNPDVRKSFDAGYVFVDSENNVYQLQMYNGKPLCHKLNGTLEGKVLNIFVTENRREEYFATIATSSGVYVTAHKPLELVELPIIDYQPGSTYFYFWADPINKYIVQGDYDERELGLMGKAYDVDFKYLRTYHLPMLENDVEIFRSRDKLASVLFPLRFTQRTSTNPYMGFDIALAENVVIAVFVNILLVFLYLYLLKKNNRQIRAFDLALVGLFGLVAFALLSILTFTVYFEKCFNILKERQFRFKKILGNAD